MPSSSLRPIFRGIAIALCVGATTRAASPTETFALSTLPDAATTQRLASRFKANGPLVFLLRNPSRGLAQGDLMRFRDKAVLVDADVWQTLQTEGALPQLRSPSLVRVQAKAQGSAWKARAKATPTGRDRKAYLMGEKLLVTLEELFGSLPGSGELVLRLEGGNLLLLAPAELVDRLKTLPPPIEPPPEAPRPPAPKRAGSQPPRLGPGPRQNLTPGQDWSFPVLAYDPDDPTDKLRIQLLDGPAGLRFDDSTRELRWKVPRLSDTLLPLKIAVEDPTGARTDSLWGLRVRRPETDIQSQGMHFPWDTLVTRHRYVWSAVPLLQGWQEEGIELRTVQGNAPLLWHRDSLTLIPVRPGTLKLSFLFRKDGIEFPREVAFPVQANRAPEFVSEVGIWEIRSGTAASYRPLALDPEQEPVRIEPILPEDSSFRWDGTRLSLRSREPGLHSIALVATDSVGNRSVQTALWRILPSGTPLFTLENRRQELLSSWTLGYENGGRRVGLFIPDLPRMLSWHLQREQEFPFVYVGTSLLNERAESRGHRLTADLGLTVRIPAAKIYTGGLYGRIQGRYGSEPSQWPYRFEFECQGFVRQALLAVDTTAISFTRLDDVIQAGEKYAPVVNYILDEAFGPRNAVFLTRVEGWWGLRYGFWGGLGGWREDYPVAQEYLQRIGAGLQHEVRVRGWHLQQALRVGWGPGSAGWSAWWTGQTDIGILP